MDYKRMGELISRLRKEKKLTQQQVGDALSVSNKTVSKWECGAGCPDVSLLRQLSEVLGTNIEKILEGDLNPNIPDGGNMKRMKFYVCPDCGNIITATGSGEISCCGRKLLPLKAAEPAQGHLPKVEKIEQDYYLTFDHGMTKEHYLSFAAWVLYDRVLLIRMYPEQEAAVRFPQMGRGTLYTYCSEHGLMKTEYKALMSL